VHGLRTLACTSVLTSLSGEYHNPPSYRVRDPERLHRLCRDRPLFSETLDVVKFICKDVWSACWDKQVDNLRTNHRVRPSPHISYTKVAS
jgi:hypothetical protein